ncbi:two-component regulator propeller domain-containing protein [Flammeovirga sp. EKP202]|uniref:type IX secretion system anionic LPS delivery protein PorZ n=1 Tax=Flammeovirga sp. EKP202 TaxID=2770592 RepID=UPI00165F5D6D|nr:two-component regulator propeller domain-containing protein [Flammeovirga sp. EKP202]MBD0402494.1 hypothetical protein [Flammeovirga sp. EKP202]
MRSFFKVTFFNVLILFVISSNFGWTQNIPVKTWRSHLNFSNAHSVAITDNEVFCASNNALFSYGRNNSIITTLTKDDGLSDTNILALGYAAPSDQLIVLYANGNLDFITDDEIVNMRTLLNTSYPNKVFYGLRVNGRYLYVCASFGVAKINTDNFTIEETYDFIGQNGSENAVFDITFSEELIYIASNEGIKSASTDDDVNKQDFNNWDLIIPSTSFSTRSVLWAGDALYYTNNQVNELRKYADETSSTVLNYSKNVYLLDFWRDDITLVAEDEIYRIDDQDQVTTWSDSKVPAPRQLLDDEEGRAWVADNTSGLVSISANGDEIQGFAPSGPLFPVARQIINANDKIVMIPSTDDPNVTVGSFSIFENGQWINYTSENKTSVITIPATAPFYGVTFNAFENILYFASNGDGLLAYNLNDESYEVIKSPFLLDGRTDANLKSLSFDFFGNLWTSSQFYIHQRDTEGTWTHTRNSSLSSAAIATQNSTQNDVWFILDNNRLLTYKEGSTRFLTTDQTSGGLPSNVVFTIQLDNSGSMWMGTEDGSAEYFGFSPSEVSEFSVALPRFDGFPLLRGERVLSYGIDGGNRKWIGTGNGLWLFSKDGGQLFEYFTQDNSPLLSNEIKTIGIQPSTGEVFIGTDNGVVSYRSDATEPSRTIDKITVFPSPVRPNYNGVLTINGLVDNASVKITDTAGNIVWDGKSYGGSTSWNLRLDSGTKPATGVYFIFATDLDGVEKNVGKFAVIR